MYWLFLGPDSRPLMLKFFVRAIALSFCCLAALPSKVTPQEDWQARHAWQANCEGYRILLLALKQQQHLPSFFSPWLNAALVSALLRGTVGAIKMGKLAKTIWGRPVKSVKTEEKSSTPTVWNVVGAEWTSRLNVTENSTAVLSSSGGTNQTIIWLIDNFSLFEINRYLIKYQTIQIIQIIQKGDFWGKNRRFFAI
jgi:hypothetical protein